MRENITQGFWSVTDQANVWANPNGQWQWVPMEPVYAADNYRATWLERSDVQIVPIVDGFRQPTDYQAKGQNNDRISFSGDYFIETNGSSYYGAASGSFFPFGPPSVRSLISDQTIAQRKLGMLNRIQSDKWNAAVAVIEAKDSVRMLAKSAAQLDRALQAAERKRWNSVARILNVSPKKLGEHAKNSASGWLQYSFGWLPLIDDMAKAAYHIGSVSSDGSLLMSARATARESYKSEPKSGSLSTPWSTPAYGSSLAVDFTDEESFDDQWKAGVWYRLRSESAQALVKYGVLGLDTPWQLLPHSYLVDWVIPVGDILRGLSAEVGLEYVGGFETSFRRSTRKRIPTRIYSTAPVVHSENFHGEPGVATSFEFARKKWESPPSALQFYIKDPLDVWKAVTSLALVAQRKLS